MSQINDSSIHINACEEKIEGVPIDAICTGMVVVQYGIWECPLRLQCGRRFRGSARESQTAIPTKLCGNRGLRFPRGGGSVVRGRGGGGVGIADRDSQQIVWESQSAIPIPPPMRHPPK